MKKINHESKILGAEPMMAPINAWAGPGYPFELASSSSGLSFTLAVLKSHLDNDKLGSILILINTKSKNAKLQLPARRYTHKRRI